MAKIYHITDMSNLYSIFECGFLYSKKKIQSLNLNFKNIAYSGIQDQRFITKVPIKPKLIFYS